MLDFSNRRRGFYFSSTVILSTVQEHWFSAFNHPCGAVVNHPGTNFSFKLMLWFRALTGELTYVYMFLMVGNPGAPGGNPCTPRGTCKLHTECKQGLTLTFCATCPIGQVKFSFTCLGTVITCPDKNCYFTIVFVNV